MQKIFQLTSKVKYNFGNFYSTYRKESETRVSSVLEDGSQTKQLDLNNGSSLSNSRLCCFNGSIGATAWQNLRSHLSSPNILQYHIKCSVNPCSTPHTGTRRQSLRNNKYLRMERCTQDQPDLFSSPLL